MRGAANGFKVFGGSSDFILIFNILMWLMQKLLNNIVNRLFIAKWSTSSWSVFENFENPNGVLLLVSC
jgi:hypothetical protein